MLARHSWRWLRTRISGLLDRPPMYVASPDGRLLTVPTTRLGLALFPPSTNPDREE